MKLPTCDQSLPSKWNKSETCTEAGLFEREDSKVRSKYHDCYCRSSIRIEDCIARRRPGSMGFNIVWVSMRETQTLLQSDQHFCYSLSEKKVTRSDISQFSIFGGFQHDKAFGYAPVGKLKNF